MNEHSEDVLRKEDITTIDLEPLEEVDDGLLMTIGRVAGVSLHLMLIEVESVDGEHVAANPCHQFDFDLLQSQDPSSQFEALVLNGRQYVVYAQPFHA